MRKITTEVIAEIFAQIIYHILEIIEVIDSIVGGLSATHSPMV